MAELATLARPYAEALFQAVPEADAARIGEELDGLAALAASPELRGFADDPRTRPGQVKEVVVGTVRQMSPPVVNLLEVVLDNGRLAALPEIAAQYRRLVNDRSNVSDATIYSAFPIDEAQLPDVVESLQRRFGRKLTPQVRLDPSLIGGIRVVVGDEVLDTSVRARLEHMKAALTA